jgi:hypothetical protein
MSLTILSLIHTLPSVTLIPRLYFIMIATALFSVSSFTERF